MKNLCARCRAALPQMLAAESGGIHDAQLREHLAACEECAREWRILRNVQAETQSIGLAPAPPHLRANIRAALERQATAQRETGVSRSWFAPSRRPAFAWSSGAVLAAFALFISMRAPQEPSQTFSVETASESAQGETSSTNDARRVKQSAPAAPSGRAAAPAVSAARPKPSLAQKPSTASGATASGATASGATNSAPKAVGASPFAPQLPPSLPLPQMPPSQTPPSQMPTARTPMQKPAGGNTKKSATATPQKPASASRTPQAAPSQAAPSQATPPRSAARVKSDVPRAAPSRAANASSDVRDTAAPAAPMSMSVRLSLLPRATESGARLPRMRGGAGERASESGDVADETKAREHADSIRRQTGNAAPAVAPNLNQRAADAALPDAASSAPAESARGESESAASESAVSGRLGSLKNRDDRQTRPTVSANSARRNGTASYSAPFSPSQRSAVLASDETRRAMLVVSPSRDAAKVRLCVTRDGLQLGETDTLWRGDARRGRDIVVPVSLRALRSGTVRAVVSLETLDGTILASQTVEIFAAP